MMSVSMALCLSNLHSKSTFYLNNTPHVITVMLLKMTMICVQCHVIIYQI